MQWKTWLPIVVAVILGLAAAKLARDLIGRPSDGQVVVQGAAGLSITVAKQDIPAGSELKADDVERQTISGGVIPKDNIAQTENAIGRVTRGPLVQGQAITETLLAPPGSSPGLAALIPPGMRAITIDVSETTGVAGMLTPGCRVDVVTTIGNGPEPVAKTVLQNLLIVAVGSETAVKKPRADPTTPAPAKETVRSVTLIATPSDAQKLELLSTGKPRLVLRGVGDEKPTADETTSMSGIHALPLARKTDEEQVKPIPATPATQPAAPAPKPVRMVTVIRGGTESTVAVPEKSASNPGIADVNGK